MDPKTTTFIQKAYQLIKAGKQDEAQAILMRIIRENQNIAEAWYLLGFALTDREKRLYAFQQVVRIDPSNQPAQQQIAKLLLPPPAVVAPPKPPSPFTIMPDLEPAPKPVVDPVLPPPSEPLIQRTAAVPRLAPEPEPAPVVEEKELPKQKPASRLVWVLIGVVVLLVCFAAITLWMVSSRRLVAVQAFPFLVPPSPTVSVFVPPPTSVPIALPSPSPTPVYVAAFRGAACPFDVPLGTRVRCGSVRVPQDREKNFTDLIELPVVIYQSPKPKADVVLFLQGGPGVESIDWSKAFFKDYVTPILKEHDMVFFDPRGTGRSKPALDCPELNQSFMDAYFQNRDEDEAFKDFTAVWGKCHDRFIAGGVDPAAFNTTQGAADVRDIVSALGYQKVNLLGISYGTRVGLTVMRDYPEIVNSVVLDSVVPVEAKMFNRRGADVEYALNKVFSDCAGSPLCNNAYPDLGYVFRTLAAQFDKKPVKIKALDPSSGFVIDVKVNGVDLLNAIVSGLHYSELVPVVPKAIYDIQNNDYTFLTYALGAPGGEYKTVGMGTYFATVCPEQVYASTPEQIDADLNISPLIKKFSLAGLFGSGQNVFELCKAWGAKPHNPLDDLPVKANIPTLIISGQYDPTTPVLTGQLVANNLPNNHFYVIPGMGHGATIGNDCSLNIMMEFLDDPSKTPDSGCLQSQSFDFFIPYDGKTPVPVAAMSDYSLGLQGVAPARWKRQSTAQVYFRRAYLFDPTLVDFESYSASKDVVLATLAQSFQSQGFGEKPQRTATHSAGKLLWSIYESKFNGEPVLVALAPVNSRHTLALVMVVSAPERDAFYKGLFIPMLDALIPVQ